jgi:hypothetical protein
MNGTLAETRGRSTKLRKASRHEGNVPRTSASAPERPQRLPSSGSDQRIMGAAAGRWRHPASPAPPCQARRLSAFADGRPRCRSPPPTVRLVSPPPRRDPVPPTRYAGAIPRRGLDFCCPGVVSTLSQPAGRAPRACLAGLSGGHPSGERSNHVHRRLPSLPPRPRQVAPDRSRCSRHDRWPGDRLVTHAGRMQSAVIRSDGSP